MATLHVPIRLNFPGGGGPGVNVWDIRVGAESGPDSEDLDSLSAALEVFYTDLLAGDIFPGGYSASFDGTAVSVGEDPEYFTSDPWTVTETGDANIAPPAAQMILTLRTSSATRSGRGRKFIGPVRPTVVAANGAPTTAAIGVLQGAGDTLLASSSGLLNGAIGVYSETAGVFRDIVSVQARNYFASLRSRRD
jgi:hypothetical protein